ncbi:hypothetical protein TNCV_4701581 [Trichonephila clavipes]|nr:hypothetical protein TNCV_4701581 [Trichonephila clavipes]
MENIMERRLRRMPVYEDVGFPGIKNAERYFYRMPRRDQQVCPERTNFRMTKKETTPKEKPESPKLRDERHHFFHQRKIKKRKNLLRRKVCTVIL